MPCLSNLIASKFQIQIGSVTWNTYYKRLLVVYPCTFNDSFLLLLDEHHEIQAE